MGKLPEEFKEKYKGLRDECERSSRVDPDLIERARRGDFVEDQNLKCYVKCLFSSFDLFKEDGSIDISSAVHLIPDQVKHIFQPPAEKCQTIHGSDLCDTAYKTVYCNFENNREDTLPSNMVAEINRQIEEHCSKLERKPDYCPPVTTEFFTHVTCWPSTPPGTMANSSCPEHESFSPKGLAFMECWPNGTWFVHPNSTNGSHWTNYTNCVDMEELDFNMHINKLFVIGYAVSLVALIMSLAIFFVFRTLRCMRIRIHIHLFLSFIMNNVVWIVWYREVIPRSQSFNDENPLWCQAIEIFRWYFLIANYMWMFCEALYLHISLVVVFIKDQVAWIWFLAIGWGVPLVVISAYSAARIFYLQDTGGCWMDYSKAEMINRIPVYITLALSLVFLINVLRIIMTIMHPNSDNPAQARVKKAARAALILIPLFGLQYVLIPFRPKEGPYAHLYEYVTVIVTSLQGLCVACLFCFANQDVHHAIAGCISRRMYASRWSTYQYTGAADSAGVYVINGNTPKNSIRML